MESVDLGTHENALSGSSFFSSAMVDGERTFGRCASTMLGLFQDLSRKVVAPSSERNRKGGQKPMCVSAI